MRWIGIAMIIGISLALTSCSGDDAAPSNEPIADLPLTAQSIGDVELGSDPDTVVDALQPLLGGPGNDTGWLETGDGIYGRCPVPLRVISWGSLTTFHRDGPAGGEFFAYSYGFDFEEALAGVDPRSLNLTTPEGIGIGSTLAELQAAYPDLAIDGDTAIDVWMFAVDPAATPHLRGQVTGPEGADTVLFLETSTGCD